jgi:hypothetical protein
MKNRIMDQVIARTIGAAMVSFVSFSPLPALADSAAPEMLGVKEVVVDYARFSDPKASDACGITREQVAASLAKALKDTGVPAIPVIDATPPVIGIARIQLIPQVDTHNDDSLDCVSWVSLTAENRANAVIQPVATLRSITVLYWRQHTMVDSAQAVHKDMIGDIFEKMGGQFAQQFRLDQPPEMPK